MEHNHKIILLVPEEREELWLEDLQYSSWNQWSILIADWKLQNVLFYNYFFKLSFFELHQVSFCSTWDLELLRHANSWLRVLDLISNESSFQVSAL